MYRLLSLVIFLLALSSFPTTAQQPTTENVSCSDIRVGRDLFRWQCMAESELYFRGYYDGHWMTSSVNARIHGAEALSCPPEDTSVSELFSAVMDWLWWVSGRDVILGMDVPRSLMAGLAGAFPCPDTIASDN